MKIMNTAGECKRLHQVQELARTPIDEIRVGAITAQSGERLGNRASNANGRFFWVDENTGNALNALGLPNPGMEYYRKHLPEMVHVAHNAGKKIGVNISGTGASEEEYATLATLCAAARVDTVEVNVSCPNVWRGNQHKPIASFDPKAIESILHVIKQALAQFQHPPLIDIKLSPIIQRPQVFRRYYVGMNIPPLNESLLEKIARVITDAKFIHAVVSINTLPGVYGYDQDDKSVLDTPHGIGGLSGPIVQTLSLRQNQALGEMLPTSIKRYAAGGISTGKDVERFARWGRVDGVQIGTAWMRFGSRIFSDVLQEYAEFIT